MKGVTPERRRLLVLLALLAAVAAVSFWPRGSVGPGTSFGSSAARPARGRASIDPLSVPVLALDAGRGDIKATVERNVFRFYVPPTRVPTPPPPPPTPIPRPGDAAFIGPLPRPTPPPPTPIVPPQIPFKAIGLFGPKDRPIVALEDGNRLINAREGDTLDGRFVLKKVNRESVDFAFVGLPPEITRRIPVLPPDSVR